MKDKCFIFYANPCITCITDPAIQSFEDAQARKATPCRYYPDRRGCSPPDYGCIQRAGASMARYVLQFYSETTEATLEMEREEFRKRAPLPPDKVKAYVDTPENGYRQITDPETVVQRVWEYACAALDLKPGERMFRSPEETWEPPLSIEMGEAEEAPRESEAVSKQPEAGAKPRAKA